MCPKCKREYSQRVRPSEHHILPRRVVKKGNRDTFKLCRDCHVELEKLIVAAERRLLLEHRSMYQKVLEEFIGG